MGFFFYPREHPWLDCDAARARNGGWEKPTRNQLRVHNDLDRCIV
jgi:hypothetical protein